jgi:hypothetical protein
MKVRFFQIGIAGVVVFLLMAGTTRGAILDWDTVTWSAGSLTGSFDIDSANAGNDVTITISGVTSGFSTSSGGYPAINTLKTGGLVPVQDALCFMMDWAARTASVTVTVVFNYAQGVNNVNFMLFDIDSNASSGTTRGYMDQIRNIQALDLSDATVTCLSSSLNLGSAVVRSGTGVGMTLTGRVTASDTTSAGNATIDFGSTVIKQFSFDYGNKTASTGGTSSNPIVSSNPAAQSISFHDVNFTPVPEKGVLGCAIGVCLLAAFWNIFCSRQRAACVTK